jgi:hypothetical protein
MKHYPKYKRSSLYNRYRCIVQRCENPKHKEYNIYGGKGIKMCEEWRNNFVVFLLWTIKSGYRKDLVLTRLDKNKDFEPDNCIWAKNNTNY